MSYEAILSSAAELAIVDYLGQFDDAADYAVAVEGIYAAIRRPEENPRLGPVPRGPFGRPIYRFEIEVAGVKRYLQFAFRYGQDERPLEILLFGPVPL